MRKYAALLLSIAAIGMGGLHLQAPTGAPGSLVQAGAPTYPLAAKAAGIEGKVVLKGIVDTDGHVKDLQVVKGPPELRQAAMDAVVHWTYHPYTDHGKVVPMPTIVNVTFKLGNKKQKAKAMAKAQAELAKEAGSNSAPNTATAAPHKNQ